MRLSPLLTIAALLGGTSPVDAAPPEASGGLAWFFSDELDLVGSMRARVPLPTVAGWEPFASLEGVTAIEKSVGDFSFDVRDLPYAVGVGGRRGAWTVFAGFRGVEGVDGEGSPRITLLGAGWEGEGPLGARGFVEGSATLAAVLDSREIEGDATATLDLRTGLRRGSVDWALDFRIDALVDGWHAESDLAGGPRVRFHLAGDPTFSLYAHGVRSRHPLGLRSSGVLVGFEASEGVASRNGTLPSIDLRGELAAGVGGDDRRSGRLRIALLSPTWAERYRAILDVDANVMTATDTGELFYLYDLGIERVAERVTWGGYFHHRSNHVLAEPNPLGVTSRNVVELGVESAGWPDSPRPRSIDGRVRAGALLDSSFGESRGWNLRAGGRAAFGELGGGVPWLSLEIEEGDASARRGVAGFTFRPGFDLRADWRREEQFFGADKSAFTLGLAATF